MIPSYPSVYNNRGSSPALLIGMHAMSGIALFYPNPATEHLPLAIESDAECMVAPRDRRMALVTMVALGACFWLIPTSALAQGSSISCTTYSTQ